MRTTSAASITKSIFTSESLQDPYLVYANLCAEGPIHHVQFNGPRWALVRHLECSTLLRDPRLAASGRIRPVLLQLPADIRPEFAALERMLGMWMLLLDAPQHTQLRKLMNKGFAPRVVAALHDQVAAIVDEIVGPLTPAEKIDIVRDVAYPLPVRVIAQMLGMPTAMQEQCIDWTNAIAYLFGSPITVDTARAAQDAANALTCFFREIVTERRKNKGNDLISLKNPQAMTEIRDNPEIIRTAVEELLRYESPVQFISRVAKEEIEVADVHIQAGENIMFLLGAANRDPRQFERPDRLNLRRLKNDHLSFGAGVHFCIGNLLARLEGQVAILKLLQKFPRMRLAVERPEWAPNFAIRGLKKLVVVV
jgi:cytochrome P450